MRDEDLSKWIDVYNQSDQVRRLADKIHGSRMLPGPTCIQCIQIAVGQLKADPISREVEFMAVFPPTRSR